VDIFVKTYAADGRRLRDHAHGSIERLLALSRVVVRRYERGRRKGLIKVAQYRPLSGANPLRITCHMGTRYSIDELLPSGHHAWKHRELPQRQYVEFLLGEPVEDEAVLDLYLKAIFRAVPLSVLRRERPTPPPRRPVSKVVSIDAFRKRVTATPAQKAA
jgi:hypothetical protein